MPSLRSRLSLSRISLCAGGAVAIALGAPCCSLFVDLGDLSSGTADASDEVADSSTDGAVSKDVATSTGDAGPDATCTKAPSRVQFANIVADDGGSDDFVDVTFPGPTFAGDFIVVGVNYDFDCTSVAKVTDSAGNAYASIVGVDSNPGALVLETWGAENVAASTTDTIKVTFASTCGGRNMKAIEYTGIVASDAVEGFASQHGDGGAPPNASIVTTVPTIVFAHTADETEELGPASGWTQIFIDDWATLAEEQLFASPTTVTVTARPRDDDTWVIQGVALKTCPKK